MKQAVILAGGKGTRLKNIISDIPKPMTPILGKPLLHYIIEQCIKYEIKNLCLLVSYKNEIIQEYFGDGKKFGVTIKYIVEDVPRGTAGALIDALSILEEQFLVLYGDTYFDIDFNTFWDFHDNHNGVASVFLHPNDHPYDSDLVEVDAFDQIQSIHPYPHDDSWRQNLVNAAVYIFQKNALKGFISKTKTTDIAKNLFPWMLQSKLKINGKISHSGELFITNLDNTSDREKILSTLEVSINNKECKVYKSTNSISQFYLIASSAKFKSNTAAINKIKSDNTEILVKNIINDVLDKKLDCINDN